MAIKLVLNSFINNSVWCFHIYIISRSGQSVEEKSEEPEYAQYILR